MAHRCKRKGTRHLISVSDRRNRPNPKKSTSVVANRARADDVAGPCTDTNRPHLPTPDCLVAIGVPLTLHRLHLTGVQRTMLTRRQLARQTHRHSRQAVFDSRQAVFDTMRTLRDTGMSIDNIARQTGFGRRTIAKWLKFDAPPDRRPAAPRPSTPRYFHEYLSQRRNDGGVRGRDLFDEIKRRGYTCSFSNLERLLTTWRRANDARTDIAPLASTIVAPSAPTRIRVLDPATGHVISPIVAAALCVVKPRGLLTAEQAAKVDALKEASRDFAVMCSLAMRFHGIFRSKDVSKLEDWLDDASEMGIYAMQRFVRTLNRDLDAVRNAVEQPGATARPKGRSTG